MRDIRLGDDIDDFCVRCKRIMNHNEVSVLGGKPAKVRCRTCHSDHDYRNEQAPPPKVDPRKAALFNEVLKKVSPGDAAAVEEVADLEIEVEAEAEADPEVEVEVEAEEPEVAAAAAPVEEEAPKPKRGRGRPKK
jgi:hypothetical protein